MPAGAYFQFITITTSYVRLELFWLFSIGLNDHHDWHQRNTAPEEAQIETSPPLQCRRNSPLVGGCHYVPKVDGQWDKHLNLSDENYCSQGCSETWLLIFLTMIHHKCCAHLIWKQYKCNTYLYNNYVTKILTRNKTPSGRLGLQSRHC